jgi:hypothetical protein
MRTREREPLESRGEQEINRELLSERLKVRDHLGNMILNGRMVLKILLKTRCKKL